MGMNNILKQYTQALVARHMDAIEKLCGAALSVGITPQIKYYQYQYQDSDPFRLVTTVRIGDVLFLVDNGEASEIA
jgi:hypothetical protein